MQRSKRPLRTITCRNDHGFETTLENLPKSVLAVSTGTEHSGKAQDCKAYEPFPTSKKYEKVSSGMQDIQGKNKKKEKIQDTQ